MANTVALFGWKKATIFMPREKMDLNGLYCKGKRKHLSTEKCLLSLEELETAHISTTFLV